MRRSIKPGYFSNAFCGRPETACAPKAVPAKRISWLCYLAVFFAAICALTPAIGSAQGLQVCVRDRSGGPLSAEAFVRIFSEGGQQIAVATTGGAGIVAGAVGFGLAAADYVIEVEAVGYKKTTENISVTGGGHIQTVYIVLLPAGSSSEAVPAAGVVLAPNVQRELDKSLVALKQNKFAEARKHLEKANKMAPSNPDILYLLGIVDYSEKNFPAARRRFESVLTIYPRHERSLLMLGQMQLDAKENDEARATLQKAVEADENNWRAHYLLALAFVRSGELPKAELEAARAGELNKEKTAAMKLLRAKILMVEGKNSEAEAAFHSFIKDYPTDAGIPEAEKYLEKIAAGKKAAATEVIAASETTRSADKEDRVAVVGPLEKPWAPPDVDAAIPFTSTDIPCSTEEVLEKAKQRIRAQLGDMEEFSATERVEHQTIDSAGIWTTPVSREFDYLIFVHRNQALSYYFVEDRAGGDTYGAFPSSIATRGLVSLGFLVVHPVFSSDFQFTCEGLGAWNGKPAWQLRFVQRQDVPSRIRSWSLGNTTYPIPLKGRVWISANSYNLLHLQTTLREAVPGLRLNREQLFVDYGPVHFHSASVELWLPSRAEMYFDWKGRRYHHKHTLSNYQLFDVDTKHKIKAPTQPAESNNK
jgi:TolA-binding protein